MMARTYLFVPASRYERILKALHSEADAIIIDLEDAVAEEMKVSARENVSRFLKTDFQNEKPVFVRMNSLKSNHWLEDVTVIKQFPQVGVMLPKTEAKEDIHLLKEHLAKDQAIIPLIESTKGILSLEKIASSKGIDRLAFGAMDYCLELGIIPSTREEELIYPRSILAIVSKATGLPSPIDTVYPKIDDVEGLRRKTKRAKQLGLFASLCIHPKQVKTIHQVLLSEEEMTWAKKVVSSFEEAEKKGIASIKLDGEMIDYPIYQRAKNILE